MEPIKIFASTMIALGAVVAVVCLLTAHPGRAGFPLLVLFGVLGSFFYDHYKEIYGKYRQ